MQSCIWRGLGVKEGIRALEFMVSADVPRLWPLTRRAREKADQRPLSGTEPPVEHFSPCTCQCFSLLSVSSEGAL